MNTFDENKKIPAESKDLPSEIPVDATETVEAVVEKPKKKFALPKLNLRSNRKLRLGATATAFTVIITAVILLFNVVCGVLADRYPWTLDLTADKTYSLSEESEAVAKAVKNDIKIIVLASESHFESPNFGSDSYNTIFRQFHHFAKQYEELSGGKISVSYVDLEKNPTLSSTYEQNYGAESGNILFTCGDQYRKIALTDLFEEQMDYTTYTSSITSFVEQKLATNISSVSGGKTVTVTFLTGHEEDQNAITALKKLYELNGYLTQTVDFTTAATITDTTGALAIVGPVKDYSLDEIKRLRDWMDNDGKKGRNLFVFANYAGTCPNLYDFLSVDYGITVTSNIIMETDANNYPMDYMGSYPYMPFTEILSTDLTGTNVAGKKVIMPLTLQLLTAKGTDDKEDVLTNHSLITFSESCRLTPIADLLTEKEEDDFIKIEADKYPVVGMAYARDYDVVNNEEVANHVVVSGSYNLTAFTTAAQYENEGLILEPLRTLCSLGDTVVISGKYLSAETLSFSSLTATVLGLGVFTIGIPLILIIICLVVFFKRRHL